MKVFLQDQMREVERAQQVLAAKRALDKHQTIKVKTEVKSLLLSKKGLATAFGAGLTKGLLSSHTTQAHSSTWSISLFKQVLTVFLSSQSAQDPPSAQDNV